MSNGFHAAYRYSAKIKSDDIDLVAALRGLSWSCQLNQNKQVSSSGTGEIHWQTNGHHATYHFTEARFRDQFVEKAKRLFPSGWMLVESKNDSPGAPRQS